MVAVCVGLHGEVHTHRHVSVNKSYLNISASSSTHPLAMFSHDPGRILSDEV